MIQGLHSEVAFGRGRFEAMWFWPGMDALQGVSGLMRVFIHGSLSTFIQSLNAKGL